MLDEILEILLELGQTFFSAKRFVVAEEGENNVRFAARQPFIGAAEHRRAQADCQFIAGEAQVAKHQFMPWKTALDENFQPAVMLHAIGERVADQGNVVALRKFQRRPLQRRGH